MRKIIFLFVMAMCFSVYAQKSDVGDPTNTGDKPVGNAGDKPQWQIDANNALAKEGQEKIDAINAIINNQNLSKKYKALLTSHLEKEKFRLGQIDKSTLESDLKQFINANKDKYSYDPLKDLIKLYIDNKEYNKAESYLDSIKSGDHQYKRTINALDYKVHKTKGDLIKAEQALVDFLVYHTRPTLPPDLYGDVAKPKDVLLLYVYDSNIAKNLKMKYRKSGRFNNSFLNKIHNSIKSGTQINGLEVSNVCKNIATKLSQTNAPLKDYFVPLFNGNFELAAAYAHNKAKQSKNDVDYKLWANAARKCIVCHYKKFDSVSINYIKWLNGEINNPVLELGIE